MTVVGLCVLYYVQAEDGIRHYKVTGVQTCALPICQAEFAAVTRRKFWRTSRGSLPNCMTQEDLRKMRVDKNGIRSPFMVLRFSAAIRSINHHRRFCTILMQE